MASVYSDQSKVSQQSEYRLEEVSVKSMSKLARLTGVLNDEDIRSSWNAFGQYVSKQLRMGRAVTIPQFGVFTFTAPDVRLDGVSNPWQRDKQLRNPVFIINKDFAHGMPVRSGIFQGGNIRPYKVHGINGKIPQAKINYTEVGIFSNKTKDQVQIAVNRVIRQISDDSKRRGQVDMEIPNVGILRIRNFICAVQFNEFLSKDAKENTHNFKTITQKRQKVSSNLTAANLQKLENFRNMHESMKDYQDNHLEIDDNAKNYLSRELAIDVNSIQGLSKTQLKLRPSSSSNRYNPSSSLYHSNQKGGNNWINVNNSTLSINNGGRPMTSQLTRSSNLFRRTQISESDLALRKLKYWIRNKYLNSEDSFVEICMAVVNPKMKVKISQKQKLTTDQLYKAIQNLNIDIDSVACQELHRVLDYNKDGYVDSKDWIIVLSEPNNAYLQKIKDVIQKNQIYTEDVLLNMGFKRDQKAINLVMLKEALKKLDVTLNDEKSISAAKAILKDTELIDVVDLIDELGCVEEVDLDEAATYVDPDWFKVTLKRLYNKLISSGNPDQLKDQLMKMDLENLGRIHYVHFKTCLHNCNLGFTLNELKRLTRFLKIDEEEMIDYYEFLKELFKFQFDGMQTTNKFTSTQQTQQLQQTTQSEQQQQPESEQYQQDEGSYFTGLTDFITKFKGFMKKNNIKSPEEFLTRVRTYLNTHEVKLSLFVTFLNQKAFLRSNEEELLYYSKQLDIDCDGNISLEDLNTFFQRQNYLDDDNMFIDTVVRNTQTNNFMDSKSFKTLTQFNSPVNPNPNPRLFPTEQLEPHQVDVLMRELKQKLYLKKLSFFDFFRRLDKNEDGFITIEEWIDNFDSIAKYSRKIKDGLFAYFDKNRIGMIDYKTFLEVLNNEKVDKDMFDPKNQYQKSDDWEWTQFIIKQIKDWFNYEGLQVEDAFRVLDADFDGFIGKNDIDKFLREVLHVSPKDITQERINRIFKLMDEFKRGQIELADLKRLLIEKQETNDNFAITGGKFVQGKSSLDWRLNAKQQIGIVLSRKFDSLQDSFDQISGHRDRMLYKKFETWVKESRALIGFDLRDYQIQVVFSELDPHKKGYLTEKDWALAFSGYNWKNQMLMEIQDTVMTHFENFDKAFQFFSQGQMTITRTNFFHAVKALFGQRCTKEDITNIWEMLRTGDHIDQTNFVSIYDETQPKKTLRYVNTAKDKRPKPNMLQQTLETKSFQDALHKTSSEYFMDEKCEAIVKKVKQVLRSSNKSIKQIFEEFDKDGSGELSNIEFKNAFRNIGIGLTSKELDYLLDYCDGSGDGFVNWGEFINKFKLGEAQTRILDRSKTRLQHINDNIHYYMLSPKDAFRLFNSDRTGYMNYNDFQQFMNKLCLMANEKLPSFAILKDIYQTIDIRKDGLIDMSEWVQTFKQFQPPNASMQGRPNLRQQERPQTAINTVGRSTVSSKKSKQSNPLAYHIESSQEYDKIMQVIGRNRKFLLQTFNDINRMKAVTYEVAKEVIEKLLRSVGITLEDDHYPLLLKFAERDGHFDYRFLLEIYKERIQRISQQPNPHLM